MCVKVLLADDAEVVREAATFSETVQKANELLPDEIVLDLRITEGQNLRLPTGAKVLAISLANDNEAKALAASIGAAKFLDKMYLSEQLIPAILELAPKPAAL